MSEIPKDLSKFDEDGLPRYLDMLAAIGHTKHVGGSTATIELLNLCQVTPDKLVLNMGCGAGASTVFMVKTYGCRVVGVDIKDSMVEAAQKFARRKGVADMTEFRQADGQDLPFEDNTFDILVCESVNTFIPDRDKAASEYVRVVKPGGYVGINEGIWYKHPSEDLVDFINGLVGYPLEDPEVWEDMLKGAGLTGIIAKTYNTDMKEEARSQLGFLSVWDYLGILGKTIGMLFKDSYTRSLIKDARGTSLTEYAEYIGHGIFVGQVP